MENSEHRSQKQLGRNWRLHRNGMNLSINFTTQISLLVVWWWNRTKYTTETTILKNLE